MKVKNAMIRYRFKDSMGCVFFKNFYTDREARLWFERNKTYMELKELGNMGYTLKSRILDSNTI